MVTIKTIRKLDLTCALPLPFQLLLRPILDPLQKARSNGTEQKGKVDETLLLARALGSGSFKEQGQKKDVV
jgi:hypothetical protein